jgi:CBS domain-containing protein
MASNPRWRQTWSVWREYYDEWIMTPMAPDIYLAIIFFDFRSVVGAGTLARALRSHVEMRAHRYPLFLKFFTRYFLLNAPPISFYESQLVEKDGAKTDLLDIKTRTLTPFVDFARIMALFHGIGETNTLGRLRALAEDGYIPDDLYSDACHAYEYDLHLCFVHQLRTIESGEYPVNFTNPGDLTELERKTLKFSFSVIERLMDFARSELNISPNSRPPDSAINRA